MLAGILIFAFTTVYLLSITILHGACYLAIGKGNLTFEIVVLSLSVTILTYFALSY